MTSAVRIAGDPDEDVFLVPGPARGWGSKRPRRVGASDRGHGCSASCPRTAISSGAGCRPRCANSSTCGSRPNWPARARGSRDFDERYRQAPPWAFTDCDPKGEWSGGALCLSVDAVGRRFPILVAVPAAGPGEADALADAALELVFTALGEAWDAVQLHDALGAVALPEAPAPEATDNQPGWFIAAEDGTRIEAPGRYPDGLIERMMELVE